MEEVSLEKIDIVFEKTKPERVVLVTSSDKKKKRPNIITLGWFMRTSFSPALVAISVGHTRYSNKLIKRCREFVVAFPNNKMKDAVLYCGTHSGRDVDKFKETKLKPAKGKIVRPPLIKDCVVNLECKLVRTIETGDHSLFVGKIVAAHINKGKILLNFGDLA